MPTYSYRCTECATAFDILQAFTDDSLTVCPTCGGKLRKLFNAVGVSFTGSGFYRNDSRPARKEGSSAKEGGSSKDGGSPNEGGSPKEGGSTPAPAAAPAAAAPATAPAASASSD